MLKTNKQEELAEKAVTSIINHYSQPIHIDQNDDIQEASPYFDPLLGHPPHISPIVKHWCDLLSSSFLSEELDGGAVVIGKVIQFYSSKIRKACFNNSSSSSSIKGNDNIGTSKRGQSFVVQESAYLILIQYEVLLSQLLLQLHQQRHAKKASKERSSDDNDIETNEKRAEFLPDMNAMNMIPMIRETTLSLCNDILSLTSLSYLKQSEDRNSATNFKLERQRILVIDWIIPTLLQLLYKSISLLRHVLSTSRECNLHSSSSLLSYCKEMVTMSTIVALSFSPDDIHSYHHPSLNDDSVSRSSNAAVLSSSKHLNVKELLLESSTASFSLSRQTKPQHIWAELSLHYLVTTCAYPFSPEVINDKDGTLNNIDEAESCGVSISCMSNDDDSSMKIINTTSSNSNRRRSNSNTKNKKIDDEPSFMNQPIFDASVTSSTSSSCSMYLPWMDSVKNIGCRCAHSLLDLLSNTAADISTNHDKNDENKSMIQTIIMGVGIEYIMPMVRAHFFGRIHDNSIQINDYDTDSSGKDKYNRILSTQIHARISNNMGTASRKSKIPEDEPYNQILARIVSSLRIIFAATSSPSSISITTTSSTSDIILTHSLPILYTLIDSHYNVTHQSLGGALFYHILKNWIAMTPTLFVHHFPTILESDELDANNFGRRRRNDTTTSTGVSFFETAVEVMAMACKTCRDPLALCILCKVRSEIFELIAGGLPISSSSTTALISTPLPPSSLNLHQSGKLRRDATSDLIALVKKKSYGRISEGRGESIIDDGANTKYCVDEENENSRMITGVLIGGIHPLLVQHARLPNADVMEMGRLGLSAFLPLIRWDGHSVLSRRVQMAALACLVSLMMGAYPIMERHGGKIMSELISCIGRGYRDLSLLDEVNRRMIQKKSTRNNGRSRDEIRKSLDREDEECIQATQHVIEFAIHAASVALILCSRRADDILKMIEDGDFMTDLKACCVKIRHKAKVMLVFEQNRINLEGRRKDMSDEITEG